MAINPALFSSARPDWATPPEVFDPLNAKYRFTLDACASPENAKCPKFYTEADNALLLPWRGRVWMNPPYGRGIGKWMEKAYRESETNAELVLCLVPARTDTAWWHDWAAKGIVSFIRGRIRFVGAESCAPFPSALVLFQKVTNL